MAQSFPLLHGHYKMRTLKIVTNYMHQQEEKVKIEQ